MALRLPPDLRAALRRAARSRRRPEPLAAAARRALRRALDEGLAPASVAAPSGKPILVKLEPALRAALATRSAEAATQPTTLAAGLLAAAL